MKISRAWLQNYFDAPLPGAEALADALTFHAFEIESVEGDILDVKITPNRGHDCLSHRGIAKELSAILKLPLKKEYDPFARPVDLSKKTDAVTVTIEETKLCKRYIAGYMTGVKVGPSPEWLRHSLESIGQRSINNVVDITNFVMFNIGQPLHAFDAKKLGGLAMGVRTARGGEQLEALDDTVYALAPTMLVITANDRPVGIAGVKGGKADGIDERTTDIVLEAANFDGPMTRKTAAMLKLRTDASQRFEQVLSPELAAYGMQQAVELLTKLAGGDVQGFVDVYPQPHTPARVAMRASHPTSVLGVDISKETIRDVFTRLGFTFEEKEEAFIVTPPFERLDLTIPEDLVEEIARIVGYDAVPAVELPPAGVQPEINQYFAASERVRNDLTALGYSEVFTSVFADKGDVAVANKIDSVKPFLRSTLIDGLNDALKKNIQNKDLLGLKEAKLFEIGTVWKGGKEKIMVGIVSEKEPAKEDPLSAFVKETAVYEPLPLSLTERYQPFSRFPSITRDIALWVPVHTRIDDVKEVIARAAGNLCARIDFFDEFKKDDRVSYAFRLVFQSFEKTLTDEEVNTCMQQVYEAVDKRGWKVR